MGELDFSVPDYIFEGTGSLDIQGSGVVTVPAGTTTISTVISGLGGIQKEGPGTLVLGGANTVSGPLRINSGVLVLHRDAMTEYSGDTIITGTGTLRKTGAGEVSWGPARANFALGAGSLIDVQEGIFKGASYSNDDWTANKSDLNVGPDGTFRGTEANVRVNVLTGSGKISSGFNAAIYSTFTFGVENGTGTFDGVLADDLAPASYTKTGTGTQILTGFHTYTGSLTVNGGTLEVTSDSLPDAGAVRLATGGVLHLNHSTTDVVARLFINGAQAKKGKWGKVGSVAASQADFETALITGDGILEVTMAPPYDDWAELQITGIQAGADAAPGADADQDGQTNLTEFALNGNPLSGSTNDRVHGQTATVGGQTVLTLTLPVRPGAVFSAATAPEAGGLVSNVVDGVVYRIQGTLTDFSAWPLAITEVTGDDATAIQAGLNPPDEGWTFRTFRVPGNVSGAPAGFLRAKISTP